MESLTQEIVRKSERLVSIYFDDMLEKCKWCGFRNCDHSFKDLRHCIKFIDKRKYKNYICKECGSKGHSHKSECSEVAYHPCR